MQPAENFDFFKGRVETIVAEIREIVDIESPSLDASSSAAIADWLEAKFNAIGGDISLERIKTDVGEHVIVRAYPGKGSPTLLLGHTDTVHPIGTALQNPTRIDGNKLYGCGVFDMKANVVLMLEAFRYFVSTGTRPTGPVTILLSCDEEVGSHTGREFVEREAAAASRCLVFEPSAEGRVKTGRKGTCVFAVQARGVPAHAGLEPEKGANAVVELARHLDTIQSIATPELGTTVNVTTFQGGTTTNVIPEHARCQIDVRFSSMAEGERVERELRNIASGDPRVSMSLSGAINRPPLERTAAVLALFEKARSLAATFDYDLGETQVGGASDGNFVAALGVPVLDGLGVAGDGAHRLDEHILISDIARRATLVTLLLSKN